MRTLLLLRHAKSSWKNESLSDHDRPLNNRGKRDAPRMGRLLAGEKLVPDLILSSTAERAAATARVIAENCGYAGEIHRMSELYLAAPDNYFDVFASLPSEPRKLLVVGHNPGLQDLADKLTGEDVAFPTAALAQIELPVDNWESISSKTEGRLVRLWRPRELDHGEYESSDGD